MIMVYINRMKNERGSKVVIVLVGCCFVGLLGHRCDLQHCLFFVFVEDDLPLYDYAKRKRSFLVKKVVE
jgi:hypothetical protein